MGGECSGRWRDGRLFTVPLLLVLILALIPFGVGFAVKILCWVALAVLVVWLLGFVMRSTSAGGGRGRW